MNWRMPGFQRQCPLFAGQCNHFIGFAPAARRMVELADGRKDFKQKLTKATKTLPGWKNISVSSVSFCLNKSASICVHLRLNPFVSFPPSPRLWRTGVCFVVDAFRLSNLVTCLPGRSFGAKAGHPSPVGRFPPPIS
ncbi:MAG: hypothetical protein WBW41_14870 [Verrucomicrobiia bacterium]